MKQCKRCINNDSVRHISYDENGICCYCKNYETIESKLCDSNNLQRLFEERIENVRGKYTYDAAVGISGGKDSAYVLYQLTKRYNLKIKTFTMINGFFSENARKNVDRLVDEFGVEHEYIEFNKELLKRFYRYSVKHWLTPCVACSYLGYAAMINYTTKIDAGICIHGRSPQQMLRYYGDDVFTSLVNAGLKSAKDIDVQSLYTALLSSIEEKLDKNLLDDIKKFLYNGISPSDFREFVSYFLYHDYDEEKIVEFLNTNTKWKPDKDYDHYDCLIHNAAHYIYQCAEGRPHCLPEISVLVRSKKLTREEASKLVDSKVYSHKPKKELEFLCSELEIKPAPVLLKAAVYNKFIKK